MNKAITKKKHGDYKQITEVGSGTYGKVYKVEAQDEEKKILAFKKITYTKDNEGFPQTALREIRILQSLSHKNVIRLHKIITSKPSENNKYRGSTFLVFDYIEHDLLGLLKMNITLSPAQLKCIIKQILEGVKYIHSKKVIHRDLKCANILLSSKGEVKIADFGLARYLTFPGNYTNCVVTLWYRAPELLLGQKKYTTKIDMWSIGCVMAELILGEPLFTGDKEVRQCEYIFQTCGTPSETHWPGCKNLPHYNTFVPAYNYERNLKSYLLKKKPNLDEATLDFIDKLLILNPDKRMDADEALQHRYFKEEPLPCELGNMPEFKSECHLTLIKNEKLRRENEKKAQEEKEKERKNSQQKNNAKKRYSETESFNQPPLITTTLKFPPPNIPSQKPGPPSGDPFRPLPPQENSSSTSKSNIMLPQALAGLESSFMVSRPMNQILQQTQAEFKSDFSPQNRDNSQDLSSLISQKPAEKDQKAKHESLVDVLNSKRIKKKQQSTSNKITTLDSSTMFDEKEKIVKKHHV